MLLTAFGLAGCATKAPHSSVDQFISQQTAFVVDETRYASRYPGALAAYDPDPVQIVRGEDPNLFVPVNAIWNGTVEDLAKHVARHLGYSVAAQGERALPVLVSVNTHTLPAIGLLRQGFAQGRGKARLEIDVASRVMTVVYQRPERSPIPHKDDAQL